MTRKLSLITAVAGLALVVAAPAFSKGQPATEQWEKALQIRSAALNEQHGVGGTSQSTDRSAYFRALQARSEGLNRMYGLDKVTHAPTMSAYERALTIRGEALNRQNGIGVTGSEVKVDASRQAYETALAIRSQELNRQHELGAFARSQAVAPDAFERAVANGPTRVESPVIRGDDHVRIDPSDLPVYVEAPSPVFADFQTPSGGTDFEWPQVGLGFIVALMLLLGIGLTIRLSGNRPLAH